MSVFVFHYSKKMMRNIDGVCHHIDTLMYYYLVEAKTMRYNDICLRPFAYNLDIFSTCLIHVM